MGIVEDMAAFKQRYHQYTDAIDGLRGAEKKHDRLSGVSEQEYYQRSTDEIVMSSRRIIRSADADLKKATRLLDSETEAYKKALASLILDCDMSSAKSWIEEDKKELKRLSTPSPGYILLAAGIILALITIVTWNSRIAYGIAVAPIAILAWGLGFTAYAICTVACFKKGCLIGLLGFFILGPLAFYAVAEVLLVVFLPGSGITPDELTSLGTSNYDASATIASGPYLLRYALLCAVPGILLIRSRKKKLVKLSTGIQKKESDYESRKETAEKSLEDSKAQWNSKIELSEAKVDALRELNDGEIKEIEKSAKARAAILQAAEIDGAAEELILADKEVTRLHDELSLMVSTNIDKNLPEEEDWAAIDALYDLVRRGYATTRQEALLQFRAEERHAELLSAMAAGYKELQDFRSDVNRQLTTISEQEAQLVNTANLQLDVLVKSLEVEAAQLNELHEQTAQNDVMICQQSSILAAQQEANRLAREQSSRMDAIDKKLSGIRLATTVSAVTSLRSPKRR